MMLSFQGSSSSAALLKERASSAALLSTFRLESSAFVSCGNMWVERYLSLSVYRIIAQNLVIAYVSLSTLINLLYVISDQ